MALVGEQGDSGEVRGPSSLERSRLAYRLSILTALPLIVWWMGWYPGFLSPESIAQLDEIDRFDISNSVPALHSIAIWVVTRIVDSPAAVGLLQVAAMVVLLATFARRVTQMGVPWPLSVFSVVLFAFLPAVSATTPAIEVQVVQTLVAIWLFLELLEISRLGIEYFDRMNSIRFGIVVGLSWLLDHGGIVIVAVITGALLIAYRHQLHRLALAGAVALGVFLVAQVVLYSAFSVDREVPPLGEAYAPEVGAVLVHEPDRFSSDQIRALEKVADLSVWRSAYDCADGSRLVDDRDFDNTAIRDDPGRYRKLLTDAVVSSPATVIGHRVCAAGFLFIPSQPLGERYETYTYFVPPNELGLRRDARWEGAFNMTKAILVRTDLPSRTWLFWRPGLLLWPALAMYGVVAVRRRTSTLWPLAALGAHLLLAVLTVRTPAFREAFSVYALSFLSLPLWWLALRSERAA